MRMIAKAEAGFTLLEVLLVLLIFSTLTAVTSISLHRLYPLYQEKQFLSQLETDLYYAQQLAISKGGQTTVLVDNDRNNYGIRQYGNYVLLRPFHESIRFEQGSLSVADIQFLPNGNISKPGTLFIRIKDQRYGIVFQLGKGRFYIEKR